MKLFGYHRSSAAYRVRIALNYKSIKYDNTSVNLVDGEQRSERYLALNTQGLVPILQISEGLQLTQSAAILEWLEEEYPNPSLYPEDKFARAEVRSITNTIACDIHPLNNLRVLKYLTQNFGVEEERKTAWYQYWIAMGFASIESRLIATPFSFGKNVSMADVYLVPQVYNALRFKQNMNEFPKIMMVYRNCNDIEAFTDAAPEAQPDG
jgi:maleylacetoacetate isomerase